MQSSQVRSFLLAVGLLVGAFGLISLFTPRGFSWGLEFLAAVLILPWLISEARGRRPATQARHPGVPDWHPES